MAPMTADVASENATAFGIRPKEPLGGIVVSVILPLISTTILSIFLTQRVLVIKVWTRLPLVVWLVFCIYVDSYLFVFATAILQLAFGVNTSHQACEGAILLCLACYVTTKVLIYLFLVEKAHIIRGTKTPRLKSKLYLFNSFGMIGVYAVVCILNFIFRITKIEDGLCIIGMENVAMIPLISFDAVVNVYLTILFLIPLKNLHSFKNFPKTPANIRLRSVAARTFVGAVATLASSIVNLTVLMALGGEPGWVCLMCCNSDILFSAIVIQWITSKDNAGTAGSLHSSHPHPSHQSARRGDNSGRRPSAPPLSPSMSPSVKAVLEDVAEISLDDSSGRSDHAASDKGNGDTIQPVTSQASSASSNALLQSGTIAVPAPGAVVVTTTIKRESKPSRDLLEEMGVDDEYAKRQGYARPVSGTVGLTGDAFMRTNRTEISAGPHY